MILSSRVKCTISFTSAHEYTHSRLLDANQYLMLLKYLELCCLSYRHEIGHMCGGCCLIFVMRFVAYFYWSSYFILLTLVFILFYAAIVGTTDGFQDFKTHGHVLPRQHDGDQRHERPRASFAIHHCRAVQHWIHGQVLNKIRWWSGEFFLTESPQTAFVLRCWKICYAQTVDLGHALSSGCSEQPQVWKPQIVPSELLFIPCFFCRKWNCMPAGKTVTRDAHWILMLDSAYLSVWSHCHSCRIIHTSLTLPHWVRPDRSCKTKWSAGTCLMHVQLSVWTSFDSMWWQSVLEGFFCGSLKCVDYLRSSRRWIGGGGGDLNLKSKGRFACQNKMYGFGCMWSCKGVGWVPLWLDWVWLSLQVG